MASRRVRISYRRSGGIAGIELAADTTAEDLPAEQAALADRMIAGDPSAPGGDAVPGSNAGSPRADGFDYELQLEDGDRSRTFHWSDTDVPASVRPLLDAMHARATPVRRG